MTVHRPSSKAGGRGTRGGDSSNKEKALHVQKKRREPSSTYRASDNNDHDSAPTTSTRLCLKNIPGNFTSRQLRDYLIQEYRQRLRNAEDDLVITDCHVLKHSPNHSNHKLRGKSRRIAFVGFQSPAMATNVRDKFHQTFALTSKLTVEYARTYQPKEEEKDKTNVSKKMETEKEKEIIKNKNKKATTTTTTTTKAKFWSNDLDLPVISGEDQEDVTMQKELKPEKVEEEDDDNSTASNSSSSSSSNSDSSDDEADPLRSSTDDKQSKKGGGGGMSDLDFLKSKQTMVDSLDVDKDNAAEGDDASSTTTSDSDSDSDDDDDDDDKSSSSFAPGAEKAEVPSKQQENEDSKQNPPRDDMAGDDNANDMDEDEDDEPTTSVDQNRLFVRNIPFATTEQELQDYFAQHGSIQECHIPVDDQKMSKGFGYITYESHQDAARALQQMDGTDFQGRFLHVMLSRKQPQQQEQSLNDDDEPQRALSYKERQELIRRKKETANGTATAGAKGWSASFVRGDAVVDSLADRLGIKKGDILNVKEGLSSGDAAVRLALGETQIIEENRQYFQDHGIDMEALVSFSTTSNNKADNNSTATAIKRSTTSLLVKNLPYDTQVEELNKMFHGASGSSGGSGPKRILLPPSRTIALVEYGHSSDAKRAFRKLAYRRFKSVPLYLEWAPIQALLSGSEGDDNKEKSTSSSSKPTAEEEQPTTTNDEDDDQPAVEGPTPSVYVKNLNFATTESKLQKFFEDAVGDVRAVTIPKKVAPIKKQAGNNNDAAPEMQSLSMGFGFVEFASHDAARKAISKLQGKFVDGHALELKPSTKSITNQQQVKTSSNKKNPTKITVRNVPFQASRTEILKLFGSFGQLKRVRLPKKFNGGHRGFAFVEFVTHKEAVAAMKALSRTHLYGRHLVLEWAEDAETTDSSSGGGNSVSAASMVALREKAQRDVSAAGSSSDTGRQANKRQKFQ